MAKSDLSLASSEKAAARSDAAARNSALVLATLTCSISILSLVRKLERGDGLGGGLVDGLNTDLYSPVGWKPTREL